MVLMVLACCCSVAQSRLTLGDPMDCSTPGLPVHYQFPEFAQTHVHWVGDATQPFCSLSSPSPPASDYKYLWKCIKLYPLKSEFYCISSLKKHDWKKCNSKNIYFKNFLICALICSQGLPWWLGRYRICLQWGRPRFNVWVRKTSRERHGYPLQYSCLVNSVDRGAWWAMVQELDTAEQLAFSLSYVLKFLFKI